MSDIFDVVAAKYKNSPSAIVLFIASLAMLIIGINHFAEDTYSSYLGLKAVEESFSMNVQIFDWTYWTMSVAPQIASVVFFYVYLANTDKRWALWVSITTQAVDFLADVWYRSNGIVFSDTKVTVVSFLLTFSYFTLGSEAFISFGAGLCLKLFVPAMYSWKYFKKEVKRVRSMFSGSAPAPSTEYAPEGKSSQNSFFKPAETSDPGRISDMLRQKQQKSGYKPGHRPKWDGR